MNWLDLLLALPMAWGLYKGITSGFIMEMARLVGLIAGIAIGVGFANELADFIYKNTEITNDLLPIIAFGIILLAVIILVHFFAQAIQGLAHAMALSWLNKIAGALFGILRMAFLMSTVILLFNRAELLERFNKGESATGSFLYEPVGKVAPLILPVLDELNRDNLFDKSGRKFEKVEEAFREIIPE
ncbi:MAG: CvpA family protein [Flavobacteriales bacterium]|jgi:membrane protein required for colicin V production|nr:CvpA family protein [Flavobacteriales bacterium]